MVGLEKVIESCVFCLSLHFFYQDMLIIPRQGARGWWNRFVYYKLVFQNEIILEHNLKDVTFNDSNLKYKTQATGKWIEENWGITVPEVLQKGKKGGRRYDGAVLNKNQKSVTIIETNFYGDGGSKLKAVAGEFSSLYETSLRDAHDVKFVWISDGPGWLKAKNPMREAFDVIPVIINLQMVKNGFLKEIVNMSSDKIHSLSAYYQFQQKELAEIRHVLAP